MSKLDKEQVLEAFEKAYLAVNGKKPEITTKPGWFSVDGGKNMRLADLAALTEELASGSSAEAPAAETKPAKKPAAKKAAAKPAKKAAVKESKGMVIVKANDDGYKAEEFWIVYLAEKEHDCRLPQGIV